MAEKQPRSREQYAQDTGVSYMDALKTSNAEIDDYYDTDTELAKDRGAVVDLPDDYAQALKDAVDIEARRFAVVSVDTEPATPAPSGSQDSTDTPTAAAATTAVLPTTPTATSSTKTGGQKFSRMRGMLESLPTPRRRVGALLAVVALAGAGTAFGKATTPSADRMQGTTPATMTQDTTRERSTDTRASQEKDLKHFDFRFFDKNKESVHAFGAKGDSSSAERALKDLESRYLGADGKGDPALVAAHAKQLGLHPGLNVNQLANRLQDDPSLLTSTVKDIKAIDKSADISLAESPADYGTFYMTLGKDGAPNVYYDSTVEHTDPGKVLVLTKDDKTIAEYRIDCGFQPVTADKPESVPTRQEVEEMPTPTATAIFTPKVNKPKPHKPTTPPPTPTATPQPTTTPQPTPTPEAKDPSKDINRNPDLNPDAKPNGHIAGPGVEKPATDPPAVYTPPAVPTPPPTVERPAQSKPTVESGANGVTGINSGTASQQPDANGI